MRPFFLFGGKDTKGYILLLSILVSSIILALSFSVYAISIKEVILASYLKDSAKAFAAADRAIECALYWERSYPQNGMPYSIYPTSTDYVSPWVLDFTLYPRGNIVCDGQRIAMTSPAQSNWQETRTPGTGEATFWIHYIDNATCAQVHVRKTLIGGTVFTANGFNTCDETNPRRANRTIQVTSNI